MHKFFLLFWLAVSSWEAMSRNPFHPTISPCQAMNKTAETWSLKGVIGAEKTYTGIMQGPRGSWHRVRIGDELFGHVQITQISEKKVVAKRGDDCQPGYFDWEMKGVTNVTDKIILINDSAAAKVGSGK